MQDDSPSQNNSLHPISFPAVPSNGGTVGMRDITTEEAQQVVIGQAGSAISMTAVTSQTTQQLAVGSDAAPEAQRQMAQAMAPLLQPLLAVMPTLSPTLQSSPPSMNMTQVHPQGPAVQIQINHLTSAPPHTVVTPPERKNKPVIFNPPPQVAYMVDRLETMKLIRQKIVLIDRLKSNTPTQQIILYGGHATGKTCLARHLFHDLQSGYAVIAWISAKNQTSLHEDLADFALERSLITDTERDLLSAQIIKKVIQKLRQWLSEQTRWLLFFDEADDLGKLQNLFPPTGGQVIITTHIDCGERGIAIGPMVPAESLHLIENYRKPLLGSFLVDSSDDKKLADRLEHLPLAMAQAAAVMGQAKMSTRGYLEDYERAQQTYLEDKTLVRLGLDSTQKIVYSVWDMTLRRIGVENQAALEQLNQWVLFDPTHIPMDLVIAQPPERALLSQLSLITLTTTTIHIHLVLRDVIVAKQKERKDHDHYLRATLSLINDKFFYQRDDVTSRKRYLSFIKHVRTLLNYFEAVRKIHSTFPIQEEEIRIYHHLGIYYLELDRFSEALSVLDRAHQLVQRIPPSSLTNPFLMKEIRTQLGKVHGRKGHYALAYQLLSENEEKDPKKIFIPDLLDHAEFYIMAAKGKLKIPTLTKKQKSGSPDEKKVAIKEDEKQKESELVDIDSPPLTQQFRKQGVKRLYWALAMIKSQLTRSELDIKTIDDQRLDGYGLTAARYIRTLIVDCKTYHNQLPAQYKKYLPWVTRICHIMGIYCSKTERALDAFFWFDSSYQLRKKIYPEDDLEMARAHKMLGKFYRRKNFENVKEAKQHLITCLGIEKKHYELSAPEKLIDTLILLGKFYRKVDPTEAIAYFRQAHEYHTANQAWAGRHDTQYCLAQELWKQGECESALAVLTEPLSKRTKRLKKDIRSSRHMGEEKGDKDHAACVISQDRIQSMKHKRRASDAKIGLPTVSVTKRTRLTTVSSSPSAAGETLKSFNTEEVADTVMAPLLDPHEDKEAELSTVTESDDMDETTGDELSQSSSMNSSSQSTSQSLSSSSYDEQVALQTQWYGDETSATFIAEQESWQAWQRQLLTESTEHFNNQALQELQDFLFAQQLQQSFNQSSSFRLGEDLRAALAREAKTVGLMCQNVAGDGNCCFHALAHQLYVLEGKDTQCKRNRYGIIEKQATAQRAIELRALAIQEIKHHWDDYKQPFLDDKKEVERMARPGIWVDETAIRALVNALARQGRYFLTVVLVTNRHDIIQVFRAPGSTEVITLGCEIGHHYQSLMPLSQAIKPGQPTSALTAITDSDSRATQGVKQTVRFVAQLQEYQALQSRRIAGEKKLDSPVCALEEKIKQQLELIYPNELGTNRDMMHPITLLDAIPRKNVAQTLELRLLKAIREARLLLKAAATQRDSSDRQNRPDTASSVRIALSNRGKEMPSESSQVAMTSSAASSASFYSTPLSAQVDGIIGTKSSLLQDEVVILRQASIETIVETHWYDEDILEKIIFAETPSLNKMFRVVLLPTAMAFGGRQYTLIHQLESLRTLMAQVGAHFAGFIFLAPGAGSHHYVFGLMLAKQCLFIDPTGETRHHDFYAFLLEMNKKFPRVALYLSSTVIQKEKSLISCGPLCVELLRHFASFDRSFLQQCLQSAGVVKQSRSIDDQTLEYQRIDLEETSLLPVALKELALYDSEEKAYQEGIQAIRQQQQVLLKRPTTSSILRDEQALFLRYVQDVLGEGGESLRDLPELQRLRARFNAGNTQTTPRVEAPEKKQFSRSQPDILVQNSQFQRGVMSKKSSSQLGSESLIPQTGIIFQHNTIKSHLDLLSLGQAGSSIQVQQADVGSATVVRSGFDTAPEAQAIVSSQEQKDPMEPLPVGDVSQTMLRLKEKSEQKHSQTSQEYQESLLRADPFGGVHVSHIQGVDTLHVSQHNHVHHHTAPEVSLPSMTVIEAGLKNSLYECYRTSFFLTRLFDDSEVPISQSFINLALIQEKDQKEKIESLKQQQDDRKRMGSIFEDKRLPSHEVLYAVQKPFALATLFEPGDKEQRAPKKILILGRAGIGKSILCQFLATQSVLGLSPEHPEEKKELKSMGRQLQARFKAVFWFKLRELADAPPDIKLKGVKRCDILAQVIDQRCLQGSEKPTIEALRHYLEHHSKEVLFILDGFDEMSDRVTQLPVLKAFLESVADQEYILITSRPMAISRLGAKSLQFDRRLECMGFSEDNIEVYIHDFLQEKKQGQHAQALIRFLRDRPGLWGVAHIAINLELICWLKSKHELEFEEKKPVTLTMLYERIVQRVLAEQAKKKVTTLPGSAEVEKFLERLAFKSLREQEGRLLISGTLLKTALIETLEDGKAVSITEEDQRNLLIAASQRQGFLVSSRTGGKDELDQTYWFIHLSFQEFYAARYIALCYIGKEDSSEHQAILDFTAQEKYNARYQIVWLFVAGILNNQFPDYLPRFFGQLFRAPQEMVPTNTWETWLRCLEETPLQSKEVYYLEIIKALSHWTSWLITTEGPDEKFSQSPAFIYWKSLCTVSPKIMAHPYMVDFLKSLITSGQAVPLNFISSIVPYLPRATQCQCIELLEKNLLITDSSSVANISEEILLRLQPDYSQGNRIKIVSRHTKNLSSSARQQRKQAITMLGMVGKWFPDQALPCYKALFSFLQTVKDEERKQERGRMILSALTYLSIHLPPQETAEVMHVLLQYLNIDCDFVNRIESNVIHDLVTHLSSLEQISACTEVVIFYIGSKSGYLFVNAMEALEELLPRLPKDRALPIVQKQVVEIIFEKDIKDVNSFGTSAMIHVTACLLKELPEALWEEIAPSLVDRLDKAFKEAFIVTGKPSRIDVLIQSLQTLASRLSPEQTTKLLSHLIKIFSNLTTDEKQDLSYHVCETLADFAKKLNPDELIGALTWQQMLKKFSINSSVADLISSILPRLSPEKATVIYPQIIPELLKNWFSKDILIKLRTPTILIALFPQLSTSLVDALVEQLIKASSDFKTSDFKTMDDAIHLLTELAAHLSVSQTAQCSDLLFLLLDPYHPSHSRRYQLLERLAPQLDQKSLRKLAKILLNTLKNPKWLECRSTATAIASFIPQLDITPVRLNQMATDLIAAWQKNPEELCDADGIPDSSDVWIRILLTPIVVKLAQLGKRAFSDLKAVLIQITSIFDEGLKNDIYEWVFRPLPLPVLISACVTPPYTSPLNHLLAELIIRKLIQERSSLSSSDGELYLHTSEFIENPLVMQYSKFKHLETALRRVYQDRIKVVVSQLPSSPWPGIPSHYQDRKSHLIFFDPIMTEKGETEEREVLLQTSADSTQSLPLLKPNQSLSEEIRKFLEKHPEQVRHQYLPVMSMQKAIEQRQVEEVKRLLMLDTRYRFIKFIPYHVIKKVNDPSITEIFLEAKLNFLRVFNLPDDAIDFNIDDSVPTELHLDLSSPHNFGTTWSSSSSSSSHTSTPSSLDYKHKKLKREPEVSVRRPASPTALRRPLSLSTLIGFLQNTQNSDPAISSKQAIAFPFDALHTDSDRDTMISKDHKEAAMSRIGSAMKRSDPMQEDKTQTTASERGGLPSDTVKTQPDKNQLVALLFQQILNRLKQLKLKEKSPSIFLIYAHDNPTDPSTVPADAKVAQKLIRWLSHDLELKLASDKSWIKDSSALKDRTRSKISILYNQIPILPHLESKQSYDFVILCGSHLLHQYHEMETSYKEYYDNITTVWSRCSKRERNLLESNITTILPPGKTAGFHHVLTELAFLNIRLNHKNLSHTVIPVLLNRGKEALPPFFTKMDIYNGKMQYRSESTWQGVTYHNQGLYEGFLDLLERLFIGTLEEEVIQRIATKFHQGIQNIRTDKISSTEQIASFLDQEIEETYDVDIEGTPSSIVAKQSLESLLPDSKQQEQASGPKKRVKKEKPRTQLHNVAVKERLEILDVGSEEGQADTKITSSTFGSFRHTSVSSKSSAEVQRAAVEKMMQQLAASRQRKKTPVDTSASLTTSIPVTEALSEPVLEEPSQSGSGIYIEESSFQGQADILPIGEAGGVSLRKVVMPLGSHAIVHTLSPDVPSDLTVARLKYQAPVEDSRDQPQGEIKETTLPVSPPSSSLAYSLRHRLTPPPTSQSSMQETESSPTVVSTKSTSLSFNSFES